MEDKEVKDYIEKYSRSKTLSERNQDYIKKNGEKIAKALEKFPDARAYIAGGSVRDVVCGTQFNDIDIFFEPDGDEEDFVDAFWEYYKATFGDDEGRMGYMIRFNDRNYGFLSSGKTSSGQFKVWTSSQPPMPDNAHYPWMTTQMISGVTGDLGEWMEGRFDYSLVRGAYDPRKEEFIFSPSFVATMESGRVPITDKKAEARYRKFASGKGLKFRAQLLHRSKSPDKPSEVAEEWKAIPFTTSTATTYGALSLQKYSNDMLHRQAEMMDVFNDLNRPVRIQPI